MRLLDVNTMMIEEYYDDSVPSYAILSHRWGQAEVSLQEWNRIMEIRTRIQSITTHAAFRTARHQNDYYHESLRDQYQELRKEKDAIKGKIGYSKIVSCADLIRSGKIRRLKYTTVKHVWIDTICIDKTNNAELSEAINSMFRWYKNSMVCLVHLADVETGLEPNELDNQVRASSWFDRGWTLQELIAPLSVEFFDRKWEFLFKKDEQTTLLESITGIDMEIFTGFRELNEACTAEKMSWAAKRTTTRKEDLAYCLLGIFDVHMPLLYGEGTRAFLRLQEEIIKNSGDLSIFAWGYNSPACRGARGLFAHSPVDFSGCSEIKNGLKANAAISTTNVTLSVLLDYRRPRTQYPTFLYADLYCYVDRPKLQSIRLFLPLIRYEGGADPYSRDNHWARLNPNHTFDITSVWFQRQSGVAPILMSDRDKFAPLGNDRWFWECRTISIWKSPPSGFNTVADIFFTLPFPEITIEEVYPPHFCKTAMSLDFGSPTSRKLWYPGVGKLVSKREGYRGVAYIKVLRQKGAESSHLVFAVHQPEFPSTRQRKILKIDSAAWPGLGRGSLADCPPRKTRLGKEAEILESDETETSFDEFVIVQGPGTNITIKTRGDGQAAIK